MKTTVFLFHPNLAQSHANKALANAARTLENVTVRDMYALYPDFNIDVETEQKVLESTDRIVLQFPMYWYSSPALLKQWEDLVLTYGWAYGSTGTALKGKELMLAFTPGAAGADYSHTGNAKYTLGELIRPFQASSNFISTRFVKPFITAGASSITDEALVQRAAEYAEYLQREDLPTFSDFED